MVFVTGDTHGYNSVERLVEFGKSRGDLTKEDFVIIAGDCGIVWDQRTLEEKVALYSALPFTVLFVDGNHENFDMLEAYPVTEWMGGKVHQIAPHIFHLLRGQIFELEGRKIFTFGGAESTDKYMREEGVSWWEREVPSYDDYEEARKNLERVDYKVDYIITHSVDEKALYYPPLLPYGFRFRATATNRALLDFEREIDYTHWFFGHYHLDTPITDKKTAIFEEIIRLF